MEEILEMTKMRCQRSGGWPDLGILTVHMIGALYCRKWLKYNDYVDIQCCHITLDHVFSITATITVNYTKHKSVKVYEGTFCVTKRKQSYGAIKGQDIGKSVSVKTQLSDICNRILLLHISLSCVLTDTLFPMPCINTSGWKTSTLKGQEFQHPLCTCKAGHEISGLNPVGRSESLAAIFSHTDIIQKKKTAKCLSPN
jgi:hypothetical protein